MPKAESVHTRKTASKITDPIFDLIETHRNACTAHVDAMEVQNRIEKLHGVGAGRWITEKACHDENEAFAALIGAAVTTAPALLAKLAYLQEVAGSDEWSWIIDEREGTALVLLESLAASIANISAAPIQVQS
jgi:hypothetical protein